MLLLSPLLLLSLSLPLPLLSNSPVGSAYIAYCLSALDLLTCLQATKQAGRQLVLVLVLNKPPSEANSLLPPTRVIVCLVQENSKYYLTLLIQQHQPKRCKAYKHYSHSSPAIFLTTCCPNYLSCLLCL